MRGGVLGHSGAASGVVFGHSGAAHGMVLGHSGTAHGMVLGHSGADAARRPPAAHEDHARRACNAVPRMLNDIAGARELTTKAPAAHSTG